MSYMHKYSAQEPLMEREEEIIDQIPGGGAGTEKVDPGIKGEKVSDKRNIDRIQRFINQFPWPDLEQPHPNLNITKVMDSQTEAALLKLERIAQQLGSTVLSEAVEDIYSGAYQEGADQLFDARLQIIKLVKNEKNYAEQTGAKIWSLQEKLNYLNKGDYPIYFPKPWMPQNLGSYVGGGDKHGKFICSPDMSKEDFRACETPYYNHFLMWGPEAPGSGINGTDPRFLKLKRKYPGVWSYEKMRERIKKHIWSPNIPSPGFKPYVAAPPTGTPYYTNPQDPHPETEGVRFFDAEDERTYYEYLKAYNRYKQNEMQKAETAGYLNSFFKQYPYKQKASRYQSPNQWSSSMYGRKSASNADISLKFAKSFLNFIKNI